MKITQSRNSREGLYAGFRVLRRSDRFQRTGPRVQASMPSLRHRYMDADEFERRCSHVHDCDYCDGSGVVIVGAELTPSGHSEIFDHCPNPKCEDGKVWK